MRRPHAARGRRAEKPGVETRIACTTIGCIAATGPCVAVGTECRVVLTGGAHGWSGQSRPFNSLDFSGGNGRVLAARDGYLYKSCERDGSAIVKVVHDNGYATTYYHMVRLTSLNSGTRVRQGNISAASETACRAADKRWGRMFTFH